MALASPPPRLPCNMSRLDRAIRACGALGFLAVATLTDHLAGETALLWGGIAFAALNVFGAATGFCVMYTITGTDTRRKTSTP
jgi:hypothetical protein